MECWLHGPERPDPRGWAGTARARARSRWRRRRRRGRRRRRCSRSSDLQVHFSAARVVRCPPGRQGRRRRPGGRRRLVLGLARGEVLGIVGESGSGKTTLGRALLRLVDPTGGSIRLEGEEVLGLREREVRAMRRKVQMVFQDPHASLNPAMTIETAVGHPLRIHGITRDRADIRRRVSAVLERVGLSPAGSVPEQVPERPVRRSEAAGGAGACGDPRAPACWSPTSRCRCWT